MCLFKLLQYAQRRCLTARAVQVQIGVCDRKAVAPDLNVFGIVCLVPAYLDPVVWQKDLGLDEYSVQRRLIHLVDGQLQSAGIAGMGRNMGALFRDAVFRQLLDQHFCRCKAEFRQEIGQCLV